MKKIITFILALVMIMSMVACGSTTDEDPIAPTPAETSQNTITIPEETESPAEEIQSPVTITGVSLCKDYNEEDSVIVFYDWTNLTNETTASDFDVSISVYQNGISLENTYGAYQNEYESLEDATMTQVRPNTTISCARMYLLQDTTSPIEVEVTPWINIDNTVYVLENYNFS